MSSIIGKEQSAFLKGRSSTDNIILVREIIHSMNTSKRFKSVILLKLDIEKAFDTVNWNAIIGVLRSMGFPGKFVSWISACISSASFSCLVNGSSHRWFSATRGIRQGDPLSPTLFILVMQIFTALMHRDVAVGRITPFRCSDFSFSHALYADDMMVAIRANKRSCRSIQQLLHQFTSLTGLKMNNSKSSIYFSKWASRSFRNSVSGLLDFKEGRYPFKYLGTVLYEGRPRVRDFDFMLDKARQRLSGWRAGSLSQAGRVSLIQSIFQAIPVHNFMAGWVPLTILRKLEALNRSFVWQHGNSRGMHLLAWERLTLPKSLGGLGLKKISCFSQAGPAILKLLNRSDIPWVHLVIAKYGFPIYSPSGIVEAGGRRSPFWKHCISCLKNLFGGFMKQLGDGCSTLILEDPWVFNTPLALKPSFFTSTEDLSNRPVSSLISDSTWDNGQLLSLFSVDLQSCIREIKVGLGDDRWVWTLSSTGSARPASVYAFLDEGPSQLSVSPEERKILKMVWRLNTVPKVRLFVWKVFHNILPTRFLLASRGILQSSSCCMCGYQMETCDHALFGCPFSKAVWDFFLVSCPESPISEVSALSFWSWLGSGDSSSLLSLAVILMWLLWQNRNAVLHNEASQATVSLWLRGLAMWDLHEHKHLSESSFALVFRNSRCRLSSEPSFGWRCPPFGFLKINVDASCSSTPRCAAGGWVCRNHKGDLVRAAGFRLEEKTPLLAEAATLVRALRDAWMMGWKKVWIETDCRVLFQSITAHADEDADSYWCLYPYLNSIFEVKIHFDAVIFDWIGRLSNRAADWAARLAVLRGDFVLDHFEAPVQLAEILYDDISGTVDPLSTLI